MVTVSSCEVCAVPMVRSHSSLKARSRKSLWMMSGVLTKASLALLSLYKARTVSWMHNVLRSRSVMEFMAARFSGDICTTFNAYCHGLFVTCVRRAHGPVTQFLEGPQQEVAVHDVWRLDQG